MARGNGKSAATGKQASRGRRSPVAAARRGGPSGWTIVAIVVIVAFVAGLTLFFLTRPGPSAESSQPGAAPGPAGVQTYSNLSRDHVTGHVDYPQVPPVGGAHSPVWLNCGIYTSPVPNENAVHSMEHGAVWITYQPNLPGPDVTALQGAVRGKSYVLLSPYPGLPAPVVASAWGLQLRLPSASDPRLAQFINTYQGGPQTPEPGAPCSGGTGNPQL